MLGRSDNGFYLSPTPKAQILQYATEKEYQTSSLRHFLKFPFFSQVHSDVAGVMSRSVSRPLLEKTFHMKIQSRKVFTHRESFEMILAKTEEMLVKVKFYLAFIGHFFTVSVSLSTQSVPQ